MRHQTKGHKLGRTASHRKATMAALSNALITHKRIETTLAKARALRVFVEPLVSRAKEDTTANRRQVFRHVRNKHAVTELFGDIASRVGDRPGGYTRIVKLGQRAGDGADLAVIEFVDYNDVRPEGSSSGGSSDSKTRRSRRTRRSSKRATTETTEAVAVDANDVAEAPVEAAPIAEQDASEPVVDVAARGGDDDDETGGDGGTEPPEDPGDPPPAV